MIPLPARLPVRFAPLLQPFPHRLPLHLLMAIIDQGSPRTYLWSTTTHADRLPILRQPPLPRRQGTYPSAIDERFHPLSEPGSQSRHFFLRNLEYARLPANGGALLLIVRSSLRQGGNVPVNVRVTLIAAKGKYVHPLGIHLFPDGFANVVNQLL